MPTFKRMNLKSIAPLSATLLMSSVLFSCASYADNSSDAMTDANIAAIVVGANNIDISAGEIAVEKSKNPEIQEFAMRMIEDHNGVLDAAVELVTKLGVTPADHELVGVLTKQSMEHEAALMQLEGAEFDKAYIDHEVAYHEAVLAVVNDTLIPEAENAEVKELLISVVPAFEAHLEHSKMVASKM